MLRLRIKDIFPDEALAKFISEKVMKVHINQVITKEQLLKIQKIKFEDSIFKNKINFESDSILENLEGLQYLENLKDLDVSDNVIEDITPISQLKNLEILNLGNNRIEDITAISELTNIAHLRLGDNRIEDVTPLSKLIHLEHLNLANNKIKNIDLSMFPNLDTLHLSKNYIKNIDSLKNLILLKELNIAHNNISDISPLKDLKKMRKLDLKNNKIKDISHLSKMRYLEKLALGNNCDITTLSFKNLTVLQLGNHDADTRLDKNFAKHWGLFGSWGLSTLPLLSNREKLNKMLKYDSKLEDYSFVLNLKSLKIVYIHEKINV